MDTKTTDKFINVYAAIRTIIIDRCIEHIKILLFNNDNKDIYLISDKLKEYVAIKSNSSDESYEIYKIGILNGEIYVHYKNEYYDEKCRLTNLDIDNLLDLYTFLEKHINELNSNN